MSLNRAVAALGAVAVVGAATVGLSVWKASDAGQPVPRIYVTSGSTWTPVSALCYNGGKTISAKDLTACAAKVQKLGTANSAKAVTVRPNSTFTIGVDKAVTKNGWSASGSAALVQQTTKYQANNLPLSGVFATQTDQTTGATTTTDKGTVLVLERKTATGPILGVWVFSMKTAS